MQATVSVWPLKSQFGIFELGKNDRVISFKEKPVLDKWINIGYFCLSKGLIPMIKKHSKFEIFLEKLIEEYNLIGYKHKGLHNDKYFERLEDAEKKIKLIEKKDEN